MTLPEIYSRRKQREIGRKDDVFNYDELPSKVRVQIIHIINGSLGPYYDEYGNRSVGSPYFDYVCGLLREELGVFSLTPSRQANNQRDELMGWFQTEPNVDYALDFIELTFRLIDRIVREDTYKFREMEKSPDTAIAELNARLLEAGIGYQFKDGTIIRIDSELLHKEVVLKALQLTGEDRFASVNNEYMKAHGHFRHGDYEPCLVECAKAFESTLKIIGATLGWDISENDNASKLISAAVKSGFIAPYLDAGFTSLRAMLESGVPVPRNKDAGHGAGVKKRAVPAELAAYQLHQTAATIVFLIESFRAKRAGQG